MVSDDAQHCRPIGNKGRKGPHEIGHLRGCGVGNACHDRRDGACNRATLGRVVAETRRHQQGAQVRVAEAQSAVGVGQLSDFARRVLRHHHRNLEDDRP